MSGNKGRLDEQDHLDSRLVVIVVAILSFLGLR
jgi:hypothetical protein